MLGGLLSGLLVNQVFGLVLVSCWMATWLGACGACFRDWREEPGLWMLSGLFLAVSLSGFMILGAGLVSDIARVRAPSASDCDLWGATVILAAQVLFLTTVTQTNWSMKKKPQMPEL
jgi:hypothetical protein